MRDDFPSFSNQHDSLYLDARAHEHINLSPCDFSFLLGHRSSDPSTSAFPETSQSPTPVPRHVDRAKGCQGHDQGSGARSPGRRKAEDQGHVIHFGEDVRQEGEDDNLRRVSSIRDASAGPPGREDSMAMFRRTSRDSGEQPLRNVERLPEVWNSNDVYSSCGQSGHLSASRSSCNGHRGIGQSSQRRLPTSRGGSQAGEICDQVGDGREGDERPTSKEPDKSQSKGLSLAAGDTTANSGRGPCDDRLRHRGFPICAAQEQEVIEFAEEESDLQSETRKMVQEVIQSHNQFGVAAELRQLRATAVKDVVWELCCGPKSTLTSEAERQGMQAHRLTLENGFDFDDPNSVAQAKLKIKTERPTKLWASPKCNPWTNTQNLDQRTFEQCRNLRRMRLRSRRQVRHILGIFRAAISRDPKNVHVYFEWPRDAVDGWRIQEFQRFERWLHSTFGIQLFRTHLHGCMFGVRAPSGELLNKPWVILTTDEFFFKHATTKCDGSHEHRPGGMLGMGSKHVNATAFYPTSMARRIVQVWKKGKFQDNDMFVLNQLHTAAHSYEDPVASNPFTLQELQEDLPELDETAYAASKRKPRTQDPDDADPDQDQHEFVDDTQRERCRAMLHRLHRSAGHPSNRNLARLIRDRGLPRWMVEEAANLKCQACVENQRGNQLIPHKSIGVQPQPWQFVGMDVFEVPFPKQQCKVRYLVMADLCMQFVSLQVLHVGSLSDSGTDGGDKLVAAFCNGWLIHRPRPEWVLVDSQTSLCYGAMSDFLSMAGIGLSVIAGEAHWQHGKTESMVRITKGIIRRLRNENPEIDPAAAAYLACIASNNTWKSNGFSPVQWAYGCDPDFKPDVEPDPLEANKRFGIGPKIFAELQQHRDRARAICAEEIAKETMTRLWNSSSRPVSSFQVGDFVFVWRSATLKARKRDATYNPEPRFIGPGRVVLIEPSLLEDRRQGVIWVLLGATMYRCAPEQLRHATPQEIQLELLASGESLVIPKEEMIRKLRSYVDVSQELPLIPPDHPQFVPRGNQAASASTAEPSSPQQWTEEVRSGRPTRSRSREPKLSVDELQRRWNQLISVNDNRRREGLPPLMQLPSYDVPMYSLNDDDVPEEKSMGAKNIEQVLQAYQISDPEVQQLVRDKIFQLEIQQKQEESLQLLRDQIEKEKEDESFLLSYISSSCTSSQPLDCYRVEFDILDADAFTSNPILYVKRVLESKGTEVTYSKLLPEEQPLFDEAKAREVAEVVSSMALRKILEATEQKEAEENPGRHLPMRWVLTWKPIIPPNPPKPGEPTPVHKSGTKKAKARVVLLGFTHPDLIKRDPITGRPELLTSSPTISRTGRNLLLQSMALDGHIMESSDAKSAFLQADNSEEKRRLWTRAVPELAHALGVVPGELLRIVGAIYGLTNAPRIFWKDADQKLRQLGARSHPIDRCIWIVVNPSTGKVCGRSGSQVDDFLFGGDPHDSYWQQFRKNMKEMYVWSPWEQGDFIYAGCRLRQLSTGTIHVSQEDFCNSLQPVEIFGDKSRSDSDLMTDSEVSQCRALLMKAQWRALQTAPQYAARIGLASSAMSDKRLANLREANSILKELKKTAKEDIVFHNFNLGRQEKLSYSDLVFCHWGDAAQKNRPGKGSTGGYITGLTTTEVLRGKECLISLIDWRSWRLRRVIAGSNSAEGQAIAECENKGWRTRVFWSLMYNNKLTRTNAESLAASCLSLLIMDSRGCYDALVTNESLGTSIDDARASIDMIGVQQGTAPETMCHPTWVPSDLNLANSLTKCSVEAYREMALFHSRKAWIVRFNTEFVSARKAQRLRRAKQQEEEKNNLHFCHIPENWDEDSWASLFGILPERKDLE